MSVAERDLRVRRFVDEDAVKEGPFSDSATKRVAVSVSKAARSISSQLAGVPAGFGAPTVPEDVVALVRAGKTLEAVKRYREVSGATLDEAQAVIRDIN